MKPTFSIFLVFLFCGHLGQAQDTLKTHDLGVHFNWSHIGLSSTFDYSLNRPKASFYAGVKYHINRSIIDNQQFAFRHRFYSQSFAEAIGITLGLRRYFNLKNSSITPYFTLNIHGSRIGLRNDYLALDTVITVTQIPPNPPQYDTAIVPAYKYSITAPFFILENTIGFGMIVKVYKNLYISQSVSVGLATHFQKAELSPYSKPIIITHDPTELYRIGVIYRFKPSPKKGR